MPDFLATLLDQTVQGLPQSVLEMGMRYFIAFTLVVVRVAGLMTIGPVFGHPGLPVNIRVVIVITLSILLTPTIFAETPRQIVQRLDANGDGKLSLEEAQEKIPKMEPRVARLLEKFGLDESGAITPAQLGSSVQPPRSLADYIWTAAGEFSLGLVLGLGTLIILSSVQLAGHMIDQQGGTAVGEIFNPALNTSAPITSQTLYWLGLALFLIIGGHLKMIGAILDTFYAFPVGQAFVTTTALDFLHVLFIRSLVLAIQVAAPLLATMSLVSITMGFLGHTVPQINVLVVGFPIRSMVSLLILCVTFSGAGEILIEALDFAIDGLGYAIVGLDPATGS